MSLSVNLGLLGFFKYSDFAITQFNMLGHYFDLSSEIPLLKMALPIGISFYTFHSVGYIIDVYRGHITPSKSLKEYALFIAFFPQLVAGPILRATQFLPQLREKIEQTGTKIKLQQIFIQERNLKFGITLMAIGFFKKMFIADNVAPLVNEVFTSPIGESSSTIIIGTIAFGIQVYCDFSGYSDIAIGAAQILGFKIPPNFNKPFFATSLADFWNRWHISLSSWVRDYLFLPLIFYHRKSNLRIFLSLILTMIIIGLWHGAGWNWLLFGLMHGVFMATHRVILNKFPSSKMLDFFRSKIGKVISILGTQYFVFLTLIAFKVHKLNEVMYSMEKYIVPHMSMSEILSFLHTHKIPVLFMALFVVLHVISYKKGNLSEIISSYKLKYWTLFLIGVILTIVFFYEGNPEKFIYFQF